MSKNAGRNSATYKAMRRLFKLAATPATSAAKDQEQRSITNRRCPPSPTPANGQGAMTLLRLSVTTRSSDHERSPSQAITKLVARFSRRTTTKRAIRN